MTDKAKLELSDATKTITEAQGESLSSLDQIEKNFKKYRELKRVFVSEFGGFVLICQPSAFASEKIRVTRSEIFDSVKTQKIVKKALHIKDGVTPIDVVRDASSINDDNLLGDVALDDQGMHYWWVDENGKVLYETYSSDGEHFDDDGNPHQHKAGDFVYVKAVSLEDELPVYDFNPEKWSLEQRENFFQTNISTIKQCVCSDPDGDLLFNSERGQAFLESLDGDMIFKLGKLIADFINGVEKKRSSTDTDT